MSQALERLHRLWPEIADWGNIYQGHFSRARVDPQARAAVVAAIEHVEVHAEHFQRRDVIAQALRVAGPEVTAFRLAADLQRLILQHCGVILCRWHDDYRGQMLTTGMAGGVAALLALEIDAALGEDVFRLKRAEALERLAGDRERRHVVLAPGQATARELAGSCGVDAIAVRTWIEAMDRALVELESPEPLWRWWNGRTLLVDRAWTLPNVDVLVIFGLCRRLCVDLILVDDPGRFAIETHPPVVAAYSRRMAPLPRRKVTSPAGSAARSAPRPAR